MNTNPEICMTTNNDLPQKRLLTVLLDSLPEALTGRINRHEFTTTMGAGVTFEKAPTIYGLATLTMNVNTHSGYWTATELRELAAECEEMAKYLDRISAQP
jgi:hypothetical protein